MTAMEFTFTSMYAIFCILLVFSEVRHYLVSNYKQNMTVKNVILFKRLLMLLEYLKVTRYLKDYYRIQ